MNAIEIRNLSKTYGKTEALRKLNLDIREGELFSLLGVNGAGKSTAIRLLSCLSRATEGDALLLGDSIQKNPQAAKAKINLSPQETAVARNLTVTENLRLFAGIYGYGREAAAQKTGEMIERFGLEEERGKRAKTLSGGMQRRLSIAIALITSPRILFLDEPTLGLDVIARRALWKQIEALKGHMTIILTTHYMEEAQALSDRIGILAHGRLKAVGTAEELIRQTGAGQFEDAFVQIATGEESA